MRRAIVAAITLASTAALVSGVTAGVAEASQHGVSQHGVSQHGVSQQSINQHAASQKRGSVTPATRREKFRIISTSAGSRHQSVLATGSFTAGGYQIPGSVVDLRAVDKMVFPSGSFLVTRRIFHQSRPLPTKSCLVRITITGDYSLGSGRGAYRGISGSGGFTTRISGVIRRKHGLCGGPMTAYQQITYETGSLHR